VGKETLSEGHKPVVIDLEPEQQQVVDMAIQSGAFHSSNEVIAAALSMLAEEIEDGLVSEARSQEPRFTLAEVEAELRALGKLE
jgi:Arc/MetJ-type ribon-helix-helix transcriptional regulator